MALTVKDLLTESMTELGQDPRTVAIGYNLKYGPKAGGTFAGFPQERMIEMPVAESLMMGTAIGMSLQGWVSLVLVERMDFIFCCLDQIQNHLAVMDEMSHGMHRPACIIRVVVGNREQPLFTGKTHSSDYTEVMEKLLPFKVVKPDKKSILLWYRLALSRAKEGLSTMIVEEKDKYGT